jgi:hypothetical protein
MEWEIWLLLVLAAPFVLYSLVKSRLGLMRKSAQDRAAA